MGVGRWELEIEQGRGGLTPKVKYQCLALSIHPHWKCKVGVVGMAYVKRLMRSIECWEVGNQRLSKVRGFDPKN